MAFPRVWRTNIPILMICFFQKQNCRHLASVPNIIIMKNLFKSQRSKSARVLIILSLLITSACQDDPQKEMTNRHPLLTGSWQLTNTVIINEEDGQPAGLEKAFLDEQLFINEDGGWTTHNDLSTSNLQGEWQQKGSQLMFLKNGQKFNSEFLLQNGGSVLEIHQPYHAEGAYSSGLVVYHYTKR